MESVGKTLNPAWYFVVKLSRLIQPTNESLPFDPTRAPHTFQNKVDHVDPDPHFVYHDKGQGELL
jgi:hypothetical protein